MSNRKRKISFDYSLIARTCLEASRKFFPSKLEVGIYIVSTPIGNLGDITLRALHILDRADCIICEDTRVTGALLNKYGIKKALLSYNEHNAKIRHPQIIDMLKEGKAIALTTDAGTPLLSDPGLRLVESCLAEGFKITAVPGASALLTALCSSGLPMDRFMFAGFPPSKKIARQSFLKELAEIKTTIVIFESPHRITKTLEDIEKIFGSQKRIAIARELTKMFEAVDISTAGECAKKLQDSPPPRGEITVIIDNNPDKSSKEGKENYPISKTLYKTLGKMSVRDAVKEVSTLSGMKKSEIYKMAIKIKENKKRK